MKQDVGSAIAKGITGLVQGSELGANRQMATEEANRRNQMLDMQMQQVQYQQSLQKTPEQIALEQETLRLQTENTQHQQARIHSFNSFDKYNVDSNPRHINNLMASNPVMKQMFPNFIHADKINIMSDSDMRLVEQAGIDPKVIEQTEEALKLYNSGDTEAIKAHGYDPNERPYQRFFKATVSDGQGGYTQTILDMQNIQERMGYMDYLSDEDLDRQLKRATLAGKLRTAANGGKADTEFSYSVRQYEQEVKDGKTTATSYQEWKAQQKPSEQRASAKAYKEQQLQAGEYTFKDELSTQLADPKWFDEKGKEANIRRDKAYEKAKAYQPMSIKPPNENDLVAKKTMIPAFSSLLDDAQTLNIDKGAGTVIANGLQKLTGEFGKIRMDSSLSDEDRARKLEKVSKAYDKELKALGKEGTKFETELLFAAKFKTLMAQYVKDMSGAAVTEAERAMYSDIISGGNWGTKEAMVASLSGFLDGLTTQYSSAIEGLSGNYPRSQIEHARALHRMRKKYAKVKGITPSRITESRVQPTVPQQSDKPANSDDEAFLNQMRAKMKAHEKPTPAEAQRLRDLIKSRG